MSKIVPPSDWKALQGDCRTVHGCSEARMSVMGSIKSRRKEFLEAQKKERRINKVFSAVKSSLKENSSQTKEQLRGSAIGFLAPFILRWLISAFEKQILDWIISHLDTGDESES